MSTDVAILQRRFAGLRAVHPTQAAAVLGVDKRTVYRWLNSRKLEGVPKHGGTWVSVRSLLHLLEDRYSPTANFDALSDIFGDRRDNWDHGDTPFRQDEGR